MSLHRGVYDRTVTNELSRALEAITEEVADISELTVQESAARMVEVLGAQLARLLDSVEGEPAEKTAAQLAFVNETLASIRERFAQPPSTLEDIASPPRKLLALRSPTTTKPTTPLTGLQAPWLFAASKDTPSLLSELLKEVATCDAIDILVSFITVSGVRRLIDTLREATAGNAIGIGRTRVRILTTTYTGATEAAAVHELAQLNGCAVKISFDGRRTRLHAKAWIFHRKTGFGSAYVGSANLSGAALMGGLEWTTKFTEAGQASLYHRARAYFDTLWEDPEFREYNPSEPTAKTQLEHALKRERGHDSGIDGGNGLLMFDIEPKHYQREMLEQLAFERDRGRTRNLVVAATGTGKTVVAALDYRRNIRPGEGRPRLLFVAHRREILLQALRTYRAVLRDNTFGELLVAGATSESHAHIFASIDHVTQRQLVQTLGANYWHTVVIDECHHLPSDRFDAFATAIKPKLLLGLTATPERSDGRPLDAYFHNRADGSPSVELRLWEALDMQLLAPFDYFACDDDTDFTSVPWGKAGEEAQAIDLLVRNNNARARTVISEWERLTGGARKSRAIVFCSSVVHAQFMTSAIESAGLPALCVTGETDAHIRREAPGRLARGEICAIVTVDLYNEGVDIPEADTLLLLRPTQSPVVFQQQIGRGLRLSPHKEQCLVLDFVGVHRTDFRYDRLLSSLTGLTRNQLIDSIENGFTTLATGCHIHLQRQARAQILGGLRALNQQTWRRLQSELQSFRNVRGVSNFSLAEFLHESRIDIKEIYRESRPSGWTTLRRAAGILVGAGSEDEARLSARLGDLLHTRDEGQISTMLRVAENPRSYLASSAEDALRAQMLAYQIDSGRGPVAFADVFQRFAESTECAGELRELAQLLASNANARSPIPGMEDVPLDLYGNYSRREILTAVRFQSATSRPPQQSGVLTLHERRIELLFVTLEKDSSFHASIAYQDYAISPTRFHWQSQNAAGPTTGAGMRYLSSETNGWTFQLFVRTTADEPFVPCGPVRLLTPEDVSGDRPMSIVWTLSRPLPARLFKSFSVLRSVD